MKSQKLLILTITVSLLLLFAAFLALFGSVVKGQVVDAESGKPIPGAVVTIGNTSVFADEDGNFSRWIPPFTAGAVMANHPCYDSFVKYLQGFDLSKKVTISLNPSTYESMLSLCREQLNKSTNYTAKTTVISYEYFEDNTPPIAHQNETVYVVTPEARLFGQLYSNTKEGVLSGSTTTIVVDSDPTKPSKIVYKSDGTIPQIYFKKDSGEWITFKASQDLDFTVPITEKDTRALLDPLLSYGKTSEFKLLTDLGTTPDGEQLVGCETSWGKESPLIGKTVTFLFLKSGIWYDIVFSDTGENPASKPATYHFSMPDYGDNVGIEIPEEAESKTLDEYIGE
ncbi:MAG TPA: hypothetical protein PKV16_02335 [Caldisericia bacterium]|nr:hypothetical protein [Caldisericia bacterium]HPF48152.1 hypothetical protein [Caldisericia bacterium]HPI83912.1 hypothetical protein [Caldisericia bacterium]HPQ92605.1 hypothetical protein [Caldisericia bacterium]HRV74297.1 hypothetical protein [Caldisericia bacterium]